MPRGSSAAGRGVIIFHCVFALPSLIVVCGEPPMNEMYGAHEDDPTAHGEGLRRRADGRHQGYGAS